MVDYNKEVKEALDTVLPTYYELFVETIPTPAITYINYGSYSNADGDTIRYSTNEYQIKIYGQSVADLMEYMVQVDEKMWRLGFRRTQQNTMTYNQGIVFVLKYDALFVEL